MSIEEIKEPYKIKNEEQLTEEIVDVLEAIDSIYITANIDKKDIMYVQKEKRQKNSGFLKGLILNEKP